MYNSVLTQHSSLV